MLFFDESDLIAARPRFRSARWADFEPAFLLQRAPSVLKPYDVLRWDGRALAAATTTDAKFASWVITENAIASRLFGDARESAAHREAANRWVVAALDTPVWSPQFVGNTDLYHGNLLYALSMFLDVCADAIDPPLRQRIIQTLLARGRAAHEWFAGKTPRDQRYTQNHYYIPMTGLLCAALVLRNEKAPDIVAEAKTWIETIRPYPPLIFDALGTDGWFFEGTDYFHYAFIWMIRLAILSERHLGLRAAQKPCFTELKHFLKWSYFPQGDAMFAVGDASAKEWNFSRWSERKAGEKLAPDNWLQNFAHVLYWNGDAESRALADSIHARGTFHWYEGFWCLLWNDTDAPTQAAQPATSHHFDDFGIWCADRALTAGRSLRVLTKSGPPAGRSIFDPTTNRAIYKYDAGHVHPDAGAVWAAIDDVPILIGPGYLGVKRGTAQNTITFDGRGQGDDRIYHALDPGAIDYARWMNVTSAPDADGSGVTMDFTAAYNDSLGVERATRTIRFGDDDHTLLTIRDALRTDRPRFPEARFRITDPVIARGEDFIRWRVGDDARNTFELRVLESSAPVELIVQIGEVITMNDDGTRPGGFEAGNTNQRGWQIIVRPIDRVREITWTTSLSMSQ